METRRQLSMRWIPVTDASGRTHMEAVWITETAPAGPRSPRRTPPDPAPEPTSNAPPSFGGAFVRFRQKFGRPGMQTDRSPLRVVEE